MMLPTFLRKNRFVEYLNAVIDELQLLYSDFLKYRKKAMYELSHNSQLCHLEKLLNDKFDDENRRIRIVGSGKINQLYIYTTHEERPEYLDFFLYSENDTSRALMDFIVEIHVDLKPSQEVSLNALESEIKSLINRYKLASKTYILRWTEL